MPTFQDINGAIANPQHPGDDRTERIFRLSGVLTFPSVVTPETPIGVGADNPYRLSLYLRKGTRRVHPELTSTPTPIWGYTADRDASAPGRWPGPVIAVKSGWRVRVKFFNQIAGAMGDNYQHVAADHVEGSAEPNPMNEPGAENHLGGGESIAAPDDNVNDLSAWTIAHLHGAPSLADSDGWADNVSGTAERQPKEFIYDFPRETYDTGGSKLRGGAAPLFWYHDHAMGVTRFNVFAGLAGGWIVRDELETKLNLPMGARELPLIIQDRNFETVDNTATGKLTGRLIHKVQADVMEFFGPATCVNGKLWPKIDVRPFAYRLRLVNGANARTFGLRFMARMAGETAWTAIPSGFVQLIGTDGGLLGQAVGLQEIILSPGERADVLIDFAEILKLGYQAVTVFNVALAPWGGKPADDIDALIVNGSEGDLLLYPEVMRFQIANEKPQEGLPQGPIAGMKLDPDFRRLAHPPAVGAPPLPAGTLAIPKGHGHSLIVLCEEPVLLPNDDGTMPPVGSETFNSRTMLFLHEMMEEEEADRMGMNMFGVNVLGVDETVTPAVVKSRPSGIRVMLPEGGGMKAYVTVAKRFTDVTSIFIEKDSWHVWKVLNLSADTHPFHIHLVQFQILSRTQYSLPTTSVDGEFSFEKVVSVSPPEANEAGWKDTARVNPGDDAGAATRELVSFAAQFSGHAGRYMYHCHILEHEDQEMMRPYNVVPKDLMAFMGHMGMHHQH